MAAADRVAVTLPPDGTSARLARNLVTTTLRDWGAEAILDEATLLVSELVTNAVVHAGTSLDLAVTLDGDGVEIAVTDRHPGRSLPLVPAELDTEREGGRGVAMVAALAPAWGVDYTDRSKRVWFRLPLHAPAPAAARTGAEEPARDVAAHRLPAVATVRLAADGSVLDLDVHAEAMLGRPRKDVVGRSWLSLCAPEDAGVLVTAASAGRWQGSYHLVRGDGAHHPVQARHVRLSAAGGQPGGEPETVCVLVDQRLRALLGEAGPAQARPADDGPFAGSPDQLVRLDLDRLLDHTVAWARETFGADVAYALLVTDDDEDELEVRAAAGPWPGPDRIRPPDDPAVPQLLDDLDDRPEGSWLGATGTRSALSVPLLTAGRLVGTLLVGAERRSAFTVEDGSRLQRAADSVALAVQSARIAEIDRRRHGWLSFLAEASELLAGTLEPDMALALVAQLVTPRLGPWCAVYLNDDGDRPVSAIVWHSDEDRIEDLRLLLASLPTPVPTGRGVRRWSLGEGPWPPGTADLAERGADLVALVARGRILGSLLVGHHPDTRTGPRPQVHLLADLAPRAALALDNARLYAERTATSATLQRSLLPPELPDLPGVEVGVVYEATGAGNAVGGDFYDIFHTAGPEGAFAFAVGDVCGKGAAAAAVTGLARTALRVLGRRGDDIASVLVHLNAAILAEGERARFLTALYGEGMTRPDGSLRVTFASAGHPLPVVLRRDGTAEATGVTSDLLGVFAAPEVRTSTVDLAPGESLVCFTDGVTERRSGPEMLGEEGVLAVVRDHAQLSASALARRLGSAVHDFAATPARDDVAILVLRARPPA